MWARLFFVALYEYASFKLGKIAGPLDRACVERMPRAAPTVVGRETLNGRAYWRLPGACKDGLKFVLLAIFAAILGFLLAKADAETVETADHAAIGRSLFAALEDDHVTQMLETAAPEFFCPSAPPNALSLVGHAVDLVAPRVVAQPLSCRPPPAARSRAFLLL